MNNNVEVGDVAGSDVAVGNVERGESGAGAESQRPESPPAAVAAVAPVVPEADYVPVAVSLRALLEAGAHYGHRAEKWNPKMLPFIFTERNRIHIINLDLTLQYWERARKFVVDLVSRGGTILLVGTKPQARDAIRRAASRCEMPYVSNRWLGGTLSNFETIRNSINRMRKMEDLLVQAEDPDSKIKINKKERLNIARQVQKLDNNLGGIKDLKRLPDVVFIIDIGKETIAVAESRKLRIPVIALVDTNVDPNTVKFPIPANDDATRTIALFADAVADAVVEGQDALRLRRADADKNRDSSKNGRRSAAADRGAMEVQTVSASPRKRRSAEPEKPPLPDAS